MVSYVREGKGCLLMYVNYAVFTLFLNSFFPLRFHFLFPFLLSLSIYYFNCLGYHVVFVSLFIGTILIYTQDQAYMISHFYPYSHLPFLSAADNHHVNVLSTTFQLLAVGSIPLLVLETNLLSSFWAKAN